MGQTIVMFAAMLVAPGVAFGQQPSIGVTAGAERLRYSYRFDNDSSFDTPILVPHVFEQKYDRSGPALRVAVRWQVGSERLRTAVFLAPERGAFGSDVDTFFQPDGDVATSGTAGDVRLMSLGLEQAFALHTRGAFALDAVFAWRRDRAFFLPADRVVTHTQPPSETREWITDRETTVSQTFEVGIEATRVWERPDSGWRVDAAARLTPSLRARLLVLLPDKYPGRDIVFTAAGWSASGRASISRGVGSRARAGVWMSGERAGSYRRTARFSRDALAAGIVIAFESRR